MILVMIGIMVINDELTLMIERYYISRIIFFFISYFIFKIESMNLFEEIIKKFYDKYFESKKLILSREYK